MNPPSPLPPLPRLVTTAEAGGRTDALHRAPGFHHLAQGVWCVSDAPPTHLQRAVLLREHLSAGRAPLRLTGATALQLLDLPVPHGRGWINTLLRDRPPPHGQDLSHHLGSVVHLAWEGERLHSRLPVLQILRSHGLPTVLGPWLAPLVDPVEALVVAAPMMDSWAITATLDALLSHTPLPRPTSEPLRAAVAASDPAVAPRPPKSVRFVPQTFTHEVVADLLERMPQTSQGVRRVRTALRRTAPRTWSPMETLVRLIAVASGFPAPEMNVPVRTPYGTRYVDVGWPGHRVGVEFNGQVHSTDHAAYKDEVHRLEVLRDTGWTLRVLVHDDLADPRRRTAWLTWLSRHLGAPRQPDAAR